MPFHLESFFFVDHIILFSLSGTHELLHLHDLLRQLRIDLPLLKNRLDRDETHLAHLLHPDVLQVLRIILALKYFSSEK